MELGQQRGHIERLLSINTALQARVHEREPRLAKDLKDLPREMQAATERVRTAGAARLPAAKRAGCVARYEELLATGLTANPPPPRPAHHRGRQKQSPARNLLERLWLGRDDVLAFLDARLLRGLDQVAIALQIHRLGIRVARPAESLDRGDDDARSGHCPLNRVAIAHVARDDLDRRTCEVLRAARVPRQDPQLEPACGQQTHDLRPQESGSACECDHRGARSPRDSMPGPPSRTGSM